MHKDLLNSNIIEFQNVSKSFGAVDALQDVSFSIKRGECHAIVGENGAGKSTLMNILSGLYTPDSGVVLYNNNPVLINSPKEASKLQISTVYQELKLCKNLSAAENIFLGKTPISKFGFVKRKEMTDKSKEILGVFDIQIDINAPLSSLSTAEAQLIEIAKAIGTKAEVLILDEPTSSLTAVEASLLFDALKKLKNEGTTIIFISHRLTEVFQIADRISVLRDGKYLCTNNCCDIDEDEIIKQITGEKLYNEIYSNPTVRHELSSSSKTVLEVKNLKRGPLVNNISFKLKEGEILGIYGLQGSGRTELLETLYGIHPASSGEIYLFDEKLPTKINSVKKAIKRGIGSINEDRKDCGIFSKMSIVDNIAVIQNEKICKPPYVLNKDKMNDLANTYCDMLSVKKSSIYELITNLSGGNQQKVLIARMLSTLPKILLADEPTRGVDVGAKAEIFKIFNKLRDQNISIIIVSSELQEVIAECDRILVMRKGKIVGEVIDYQNREEQILKYSFTG